MVAVTTKNPSFEEDLTIVVVKQVLVYNFKRLIVMWLESNRAHFMDVRCRNALLACDIKICLGFHQNSSSHFKCSLVDPQNDTYFLRQCWKINK